MLTVVEVNHGDEQDVVLSEVFLVFLHHVVELCFLLAPSMSSDWPAVVALEVFGVKELDVEVEAETACARCLLVVLLLDVFSRGTAFASPSSFLMW